jgi:hypothetical protein
MDNWKQVFAWTAFIVAVACITIFTQKQWSTRIISFVIIAGGIIAWGYWIVSKRKTR